MTRHASHPSPTVETEAWAEQLLADFRRAQEDWPSSKRLNLCAQLRSDAARMERRLDPAFAACAVIGVLLAGGWALRNLTRVPDATLAAEAAPAQRPSAAGDDRRWKVVAAEGLGLIEVSDSACLARRDLAAERQVHLSCGVLRAQIDRQDPARPMVVVTPDLRVVVVGTRFDVTMASGLTTVEVIEGSVRVETDAASMAVRAGEAVRSDDARLRPAPLPSPSARPAPMPDGTRTRPARLAAPPSRPVEEAGAAVQRCENLPSVRRSAECLRRLAQGSGLTAESAQFALGVLARDRRADLEGALAAWSSYGERFPTGVLAREALLGSFELLLRLGRIPEAIDAAAAFEARFEDDSRVSNVALARARLLCGPGGSPAAGRAILERLALAPDPALREQARAAQTACLEAGSGPVTIPTPSGVGPAPPADPGRR